MGVRRGFRWVQVFVIIACSGIFGAVGFVLWKAVFDPPRHTVPYVDFYRDGIYPFRSDPELAVKPSSNYVGRLKRTAVTPLFTDSRGARVDGPGLPELKQVDLVGIGGSLTWGVGIRNEQTFTSLAAKALGMTSLNLAVDGYGGVQSLLRLRQNINLGPKVILYGFWADHWKRNVRRCQNIGAPLCLEVPRVTFDQAGNPGITFPSDPESTLQHIRSWYLEASGGEFSSFWSDVYWTVIRLFQIGENSLQEQWLNSAESWPEQVRSARFVLEEMKRTADRVGARLIVIYIPKWEFLSSG